MRFRKTSHLIAVVFAVTVAITAVCCKSPVDSTPVDPTLSSIQANIFNKSCTTSSCHSANYHASAMSLVSGQAYATLIGITPENDVAAKKGWKRVVPGYPDSSFLYIKVHGPDEDNGEGDQMPQEVGALTAAQIDAVRQWIANGAKNN